MEWTNAIHFETNLLVFNYLDYSKAEKLKTNEEMNTESNKESASNGFVLLIWQIISAQIYQLTNDDPARKKSSVAKRKQYERRGRRFLVHSATTAATETK